MNCLKQRPYRYTAISLSWRLIGISQQVQQNILKVKNGDDHFGLNVLNQDSMNFFDNHGHDNKR